MTSLSDHREPDRLTSDELRDVTVERSVHRVAGTFAFVSLPLLVIALFLDGDNWGIAVALSAVAVVTFAFIARAWFCSRKLRRSRFAGDD